MEIVTDKIVQKAKSIANKISTVEISAIVTFWNIDENVEDYFEALKTTLDSLNKRYEIILVDDGSEDQTYFKLKKLVTVYQNVHLIRMRCSFGEASAFEAGFKLSKGERIIFYTTRVRPNAQQLPKLIERLDKGYDLVVGWRYPRRDSMINQLISRLFNFIIAKLAGLKLHDINSGIIVTRRDVLDHIQVYGGLNQFIPVLAQKQGYKITEEKIEQLKGFFRKSRFIGDYFKRSLDILSVIFLTRYSKKPIHFLGILGGIFMLAGGIINVYLFIYRILQLGPIAGRPLLLLGAILLVIGIQMVAMGLIGEMIIFTHTGDIKDYNIEEILE